jgi:hypothetical protein
MLMLNRCSGYIVLIMGLALFACTKKEQVNTIPGSDLKPITIPGVPLYYFPIEKSSLSINGQDVPTVTEDTFKDYPVLAQNYADLASTTMITENLQHAFELRDRNGELLFVIDTRPYPNLNSKVLLFSKHPVDWDKIETPVGPPGRLESPWKAEVIFRVKDCSPGPCVDAVITLDSTWGRWAEGKGPEDNI